MKYAIGEIILVVIGILIALSINNWNSIRIQKRKESLFLNGLNKEFKANKIQLDSVLKKHKYSMKSVEYLMSRLPIKNTKKRKFRFTFLSYLSFGYILYV